jgi:hypothetical protein
VRWRVAVLVPLLSLALAGCIPASPDVGTYRAQALQTLQTATSEVATVQKLLEQQQDGRIFSPVVITQLRYSEDSLAKRTQAFSALNPPPSQDDLDTKCTAVLGTAQDLLGDARVAAHRSDLAEYPQLLDQLDRVSTRLDDLERTLS